MEQHPVPQNISSYQFHLVGDMTLKQFLEVAGGVLIGVLIYATGLPAIIKWPLILFFAGMGAALAFVPFQERPLEQWIFAFFRSVYSPTLFHWEKKSAKYFQDEEPNSAKATARQANTISNIPFLKKLEESESNYLSMLTGIFSPIQQNQQADSAVNETQAPNMPEEKRETVINIPITQPQVNPNSASVNITASSMPSSTGSVLTMHGSTPLITGLSSSGPTVGQRDVQIPRPTFISLNDQAQSPGPRPQVVVQEMPSGGVNLTQTNVATTLNSRQLQNVQQAQFSADAAPPSIPEIKNTVSGQVLSNDMKIIDGAILEILDGSGRPVRALRSNRAGHFLIVTPLEEGTYTIVAEKDGYQFDPVAFEANGGIISPIAIKSR